MSFIYDFADTWDNAGTVFNSINLDVTDSASNVESNLINTRVGGSTIFRVRKDGSIFNNGRISTSRGILTADEPVHDITVTWNNAAVVFTGLRFNVTNTASNANSILHDYQVNGVSRVRIVNGSIGLSNFGSLYQITNPGFNIKFNGTGTIDLNAAGGEGVVSNRNVHARHNSGPYGFLAYNQFTNASNYSRLAIVGTATAHVIQPQALGTGVLRPLHISGLPTSNPGPGILWNDAGTVKVGT